MILNNNYIEEFTSAQLLDLFIKHLDDKLELTGNSNLVLYCRKDFSFISKDKNSLDIVNKFDLDDLFNSCNNVICDDSLFETKEELISTIYEALGEDALSKMIKEIYGRFEILSVVQD